MGCLTTAELGYDSKSDGGLEHVQLIYRKDGRRQALQVGYRLNTLGKHNVKTGEITYLLLLCEADWERLYNVIALRQCSGKPAAYERFGYLRYNNIEQFETDKVEWFDGVKKTEVTII